MRATRLTPAAESIHSRTADKLADNYLFNLEKFEEQPGAKFTTLGRFLGTPLIRSSLYGFFATRATARHMPRLTPRWDLIEAEARYEIRRRLEANPVLSAKLIRIRDAEKAADVAEQRAAIAAMPLLPLHG